MSLSLNTFQTTNSRVDVTYKLTGQPEPVQLSGVVVRPGTPFNNGTIVITTHTLPHSTKGIVLAIDIQALKELELVHFEAKYSVDLTEQRMLANGFQSWSQAREMDQNDKIPSIRSSIAWYTQYNLQGDYDFFPHSGEKGQIHSSSYTHFRDIHNVLRFFGSISESLGYTYFKSDYNNNILSVYKDVFGKTIAPNQTLELIRIFIGESNQEGALWDMYGAFFEDKRCLKGNTAQRHVNGWTSWYNYYGDVSEEIVFENVDALVKHKYPINVFQIDDGFQTAIGDWLSINKKFPSGMKSVASKIKGAGFMAGLWLAPYAVGFNSNVAKKHPDWLIQDPITKKPVVAGPNWGGFYALDMYHPQAREYLREVFHVVLEDWGFDMVKLDFLFAAAMIPRLGKSRGEIMWDAMEQIRELVGPDKLILGCGVPLAAAWRKVDYCRIGSDVSPWWEDTKLKLLHVRERVSTANSLVSTLSRWAMSDRMFGNDPDVMILRNKKNKLKPSERYTLCVLNNILGALVFSSDNVGDYGKDEHLLYAATFPKVVAHVESVIEFRPEMFLVHFTVANKGGEPRHYTTISNMTGESQTCYLPPSDDETHLYFATNDSMHMTKPDKREPLFYHPSSRFTLEEHETKTFLHIPPPSPENNGKVTLMGSTSHIVPGAEVELLDLAPDGSVQIKFRKENQRQRKVYICLGNQYFATRAAPSACKVNGVMVPVEIHPISGNGEGRTETEVAVAVVEA